MADIAKEGSASTPRTIYLKDYKAPDYLVDSVDLRFELSPSATRVSSRMAISLRDPNASGTRQLVLNGQNLTLDGIRHNGDSPAESA